MDRYECALRALLGALLLPTLGNSQELVFDTSFNTTNGVENGGVYAVAVLPDGHILCGGQFDGFNGTQQKSAFRLTADGDIDPTFAPQILPGIGDGVFAIAVQSDGHILLAGAYEQINGSPVHGLARVDAAGATDGTFTNTHEGYYHAVAVADNRNIFAGGTLFSGAGGLVILDPSGGTLVAGIADDAADHLERTPEGDVLCGGRFNSLFGGPGRLGRITSTGTLDAGFTAVITTDLGYVNDLAIQADGRLLIAGDFTQVDGVSRNNLARLQADGTLDASFDPGTGFDASVNAIAVLSNGDILASGPFTTYNGTPLNGTLVRLGPTGALLASYAGASTIYDMDVQPDGKVLLGGEYLYFGTAIRNGIMRLMPDAGTGLLPVTSNAFAAAYDPLSRVLTLSGLPIGSGSLAIQDMSGRTVLRNDRPVAGDRIDIAMLRDGAYIVSAGSEGRSFRAPFVKY